MQKTHVLALAFLVLLSPLGRAEELMDAKEKEQIIRGKTRLLRACPKRYARFKAADRARGEVELIMEGEKDPRIWKIDADAEIKVHGFWGRLEELRPQDRVWTWIRLDRRKRPTSLFLLTDEISEQEIHDLPYALDSVREDERTLVVKRKGDEARTLRLDDSLRIVKAEEGVFVIAAVDSDKSEQLEARLRLGDAVYVQTRGESARLVLSKDGLAKLRERQRARRRDGWRREGLPATVSFLHEFAGEIEVVLDHEALRWGRNLHPEDGAEIRLPDPIRAVVLEVRPWCERTRVRLAARGFDISGLAPGRRVSLRVAEPPAEVLASKLPPDVGRERSRAARIQWFLASTYCSCSIGGDGCTGMFYTLAGCNPKACGMPNRIRKLLCELIDQELTDREIFTKLEEERGHLVLRQHLLR